MIIYTKILHNLRIQGHSELILLFSLRCLAANNIELPQTAPKVCLSCWVMLAHSGHQTAVASCISAGSAFASAISVFGNSKKVVGPGGGKDRRGGGATGRAWAPAAKRMARDEPSSLINSCVRWVELQVDQRLEVSARGSLHSSQNSSDSFQICRTKWKDVRSKLVL